MKKIDKSFLIENGNTFIVLAKDLYFDEKRDVEHILHGFSERVWINNEFEIIEWTAPFFPIAFDETTFDMHDLLDGLFPEFGVEFFHLKIHFSLARL